MFKIKQADGWKEIHDSAKQDVLTTEQLAACNSGITTTSVGQIGTNTTNIETINNSDVMTSGINATKVGTYDGYATGKLDATKSTYQTTEPSAAITDGGVHIVYLEAEPSTYYDGYIYLIKE